MNAQLRRWPWSALPRFLVLFAATLFFVGFSALHARNHDAFGSLAFDTGIYDQAIWLLSRDLNPFMTVRGMYVHGHHVNPVLFLFVPAYWLGAGPKFLFAVQSLVFALGAAPVFGIARLLFATDTEQAERAPSPPPVEAESPRRWFVPRWSDPLRPRSGTSTEWLAAGAALLYLGSPMIQWVNWAHFHPESLATTFFLAAWWYALRRRWRSYALFVLLVLMTREEAALAVAVLGVVLLWDARRSLWTDLLRNRGRRAALLPGLATLCAGLAWYLVATKLVLPAFNNGRPPYYLHAFFESLGGSVTGIAKVAVTDPGQIVSLAIEPSRLRYYRDLGLPTLFVFLLSPPHLLVAAPSLVSNVLTDSPYPRMIHYQYAAVLAGPLWIATLHGLARFRRSRRVLGWVIGALCVSTVLSSVTYSPSPISRTFPEWHWQRPTAHTRVIQTAVDLIPSDAGVTGTYNVVPHLSHRRYAYDWPNPFQPTFWGNYDTVVPTDPPDPTTSSWILADVEVLNEEERSLLNALMGETGDFEMVFYENNVVIAKRKGVALPRAFAKYSVRAQQVPATARAGDTPGVVAADRTVTEVTESAQQPDPDPIFSEVTVVLED